MQKWSFAHNSVSVGQVNCNLFLLDTLQIGSPASCPDRWQAGQHVQQSGPCFVMSRSSERDRQSNYNTSDSQQVWSHVEEDKSGNQDKPKQTWKPACNRVALKRPHDVSLYGKTKERATAWVAGELGIQTWWAIYLQQLHHRNVCTRVGKCFLAPKQADLSSSKQRLRSVTVVMLVTASKRSSTSQRISA